MSGKVQENYQRIDTDFLSRGDRCSGWLYLPTNRPKPPVVIMAHGFAAEKTFSLPPFAERFASEGLGVLLFDYRNFGDSDGKPRNYVHPFRHIQDWEAAIKHARGLDSVDATKLALWGTSFSGGHVLCAASRDKGITAVISQIPFVDGISSALMDRLGDTAAAVVAGIRDGLRAATFRAPYRVPAVAKPGTFAVMNTAESWAGYRAMIPEDSAWENSVPARVFLTIPFYRPIASVGRIECPVLIVGSTRDSLIPINAVRRTAAKIRRCEYKELDCGHFEPYAGELFEKNMAWQIEFLRKHLL